MKDLPIHSSQATSKCLAPSNGSSFETNGGSGEQGTQALCLAAVTVVTRRLRLETGRGRNGGCSYPSPLQGCLVSGIGDNPIRESSQGDKAWLGHGLADHSLALCHAGMCDLAGFPVFQGSQIGRGELVGGGWITFPKARMCMQILAVRV